jgi:hypothetical protein
VLGVWLKNLVVNRISPIEKRLPFAIKVHSSGDGSARPNGQKTHPHLQKSMTDSDLRGL